MSAPVQPVVHTPGPWTLGDENNQCCEVVLGDKHNLTVDLDRQDSNTGKFVIERDEMLANARLIAASPAMLEEIANAIDALDPEMSRHEIVELRERLIRFRSSIKVV